MLPAVIIAAGKGTRLYPYTKHIPKCLLELTVNTTIIDFILQRLHSAGIKEIYIITRDEFKKDIESRVGERAIVMALDSTEEFNNLYPVVWAIRNINLGKFLLLMSDHIFEKEMLRRILAVSSEKAFVLCLDRRPSWSKAVEGLKVKCTLDGVYDVGKTITPLHGIDTGLIMCNEKAHKYILRAFRNLGFKASVSDALKLAAEDGEVGFIDVTGLQWLDIDVVADLAKARKLYWSILRKELREETSSDPFIKYLIKPLSTRLSTYLHRRNLPINLLFLQVLSCIIALIVVYLVYLNMYFQILPLVPLVLLIDETMYEFVLLSTPARRVSIVALLLRILSDTLLMLAIGLLYTGPLHRLIVPLAVSGIVLMEYANLVNSYVKSVEYVPKEILPTARGLRHLSLLIAILFEVPSLALLCSIAVLVLSIARPITSYFTLLKTLSPTVSRKTLIPVIDLGSEDLRYHIRYNTEVILVNTLNLLLCTLFVWLISPYIPGISITLGALEFKLDLVVQLIYGTLLLVYGYRIVRSLKFFTELLWKHIAERLHITSTVYSSLVLNITYVLILIFLWYAIVPPLSVATGRTHPLPLLVSISIAIAIVVLIYRLVKMTRRYLTGYWNKLLESIVDRIFRIVSPSSLSEEVEDHVTKQV